MIIFNGDEMICKNYEAIDETTGKCKVLSKDDFVACVVPMQKCLGLHNACKMYKPYYKFRDIL